MLVYRIARTESIQDLSGYGAKLNGGRWNREGVSVLYTGSNLSLCAWDLPTQVRLNQRTFSAATVYVPDDSIKNPDVLTEGWQQNNSSLHEITDDWINEGEF